MGDLCWEYRDIQATSFDVHRTLDLICLSGKRQMCIVNAGNPASSVARFGRASKWEASITRWSPQGSLIAVSGSQTIDLYNVQQPREKVTVYGSTCAHPRTVADIDWCGNEERTFATCCVDDAICIWDTRDLKRPAMQLTVVAGAHQVKFCTQRANILATAHDCHVKIWDTRKSTIGPAQYIPCHLSKVNAIDWNPTSDAQLLTAGQDSTFKIWNIASGEQPIKPVHQAHTPNPVWKAKFTPSGLGVATIALPSASASRFDQYVCMWRATDIAAPVQNLHGHTDHIVDVSWRNAPLQHDGCSQLFTVGKDHCLRSWLISDALFVPDPPADLNGPRSGLMSRELSMDVLEEGSNSQHSAVLAGVLGSLASKSTLNTTPSNDDDEQGDDEADKDETLTTSGTADNGALQAQLAAVDSNRALLQADGVCALQQVDPVACSVTLLLTHNAVNTKLNVVLDADFATNNRVQFHVIKTPKSESAVTSAELQQRTTLNSSARQTFIRQCQTLCNEQPVSRADKLKLSSSNDGGLMLEASASLGKPQQQDSLLQLLLQLPAVHRRVVEAQENQWLLQSTTQQLPPSMGRQTSLGSAQRALSSQGNMAVYNGVYSSYSSIAYDKQVPFPKTCAARFSPNGRLVTFGRMELVGYADTTGNELLQRKASTSSVHGSSPTTPRSLHDLRYAQSRRQQHNPIFTPQRTPASYDVKSYYLKQSLLSSASEGGALMYYGTAEPSAAWLESVFSAHVYIYDASALTPCCKQLAIRYVVPVSDSAQERVRVCQHNAAVAAKLGRPAIAKMWSVLASSVQPPYTRLTVDGSLDPTGFYDMPWVHSAFGRQLVHNIIKQHVALGDIQTAAMVACVLDAPSQSNELDPLAYEMLMPSTQASGSRRQSYGQFWTAFFTPPSTVPEQRAVDQTPQPPYSTTAGNESGTTTVAITIRKMSDPFRGNKKSSSTDQMLQLRVHNTEMASVAVEGTVAASSRAHTSSGGNRQQQQQQRQPPTLVEDALFCIGPNKQQALNNKSGYATVHATGGGGSSSGQSTSSRSQAPNAQHDTNTLNPLFGTQRQRSNSLREGDRGDSIVAANEPVRSSGTVASPTSPQPPSVSHSRQPSQSQQQPQSTTPTYMPELHELFRTVSVASSAHPSPVTATPGPGNTIHSVQSLLAHCHRWLTCVMYDVTEVGALMERVKVAYVELLDAWRLHTQAARLRKYCASQVNALPTNPGHAGFTCICATCGHATPRLNCARCNNPSFCCTICQQYVRVCGHGGHVAHVRDWFAQFDTCPANCGCRCINANMTTVNTGAAAGR